MDVAEHESPPDCAGHISELASPNAPEIQVRDYFARHLRRVRPTHRLVRREQGYSNCGLRADMRTVDEHDVIREWEFKIHADYRAIGQILAYVALARNELGFRSVRGVLAAFSFAPEVALTNEVMNLGLEILIIPEWMRAAGGLPRRATIPRALPQIPSTSFNPAA